MLLAVGLVDLLPQQGFAVGVGVDEQPFDVRRLQFFARARFIVGNRGRQHGFGAVVRDFDVAAV
nr:MAG TPA: hypothetical protein [Caudoviricetes sp.]